MKVIDLTQTIIDNMQVYPGDRPPALKKTHSIEKDSYTNHLLTIGMHVGTHIDGPWHMVEGKCLIGDVPLNSLMGKACIIDIRNETVFSNVQLIKEKAQGCRIILFYTGYGEYFGLDKYNHGYPLIGDNVAEAIVEMGIALVCIDSFSPDIEPYQTHKILLGNGVLIAENLTNLHLLLSEREFDIIALPLKIAADSAPARIVALIK